MTPLSILKSKQFGFLHADLKCRNVFVKNIDGKPKFKIADFDKSSIFWKGIRFHLSLPTKFAGLLNNKLFDKGYIPSDDSTYYCLNTYMLNTRITEDKNILQMYTMYSWNPIYMSFDIYTFVLSLLREPKVWRYMIPKVTSLNIDIKTKINKDNSTESKFFNLCAELWFPDDWIIIIAECNRLYDLYETYDDAGKINHLIKMRSITEITTYIGISKMKLKINIDHIYTMLNIVPPSYYDSIINSNTYDMTNKYLLLSNQPYGGIRHICIDKCTNNNKNKNYECHTPPYSTITNAYSQLDTDNCTPPV